MRRIQGEEAESRTCEQAPCGCRGRDHEDLRDREDLSHFLPEVLVTLIFVSLSLSLFICSISHSCSFLLPFLRYVCLGEHVATPTCAHSVSS